MEVSLETINAHSTLEWEPPPRQTTRHKRNASQSPAVRQWTGGRTRGVWLNDTKGSRDGKTEWGSVLGVGVKKQHYFLCTYWYMGCWEGRLPLAGIHKCTCTPRPPWWWRGWVLDSFCTVPLCPTWTDPQDRLTRTGGRKEMKQITDKSTQETGAKQSRRRRAGQPRVSRNSRVIFYLSGYSGARWLQRDRQDHVMRAIKERQSEQWTQ